MWPEGLARPTKAHSDPSVLQTIVVDLQASALRLTYRNPVVEQRYQKWYAEQVARVSRGVTGRRGCKTACLYVSAGTAEYALPANVRGSPCMAAHAQAVSAEQCLLRAVQAPCTPLSCF